MKPISRITQCLLVAAAAGLLSGCLVRRTVTKGGSVVTDRYVVKRPLKNDTDSAQ